MNVAGLAAVLTALIGALAAVTTLLSARSQLRVLERSVAIREKLESGSDARKNVVQMESALSSKLLKRVQRSTQFGLMRWGFIGLALGSAFAVIPQTDFVYGERRNFGFEDLGIFLG